LVSISLRYNVPIPKILEQLNKESTFADFEKVITKILKKYIPDNTKYDKVCPNCGKNSLIYIDGCVTCQECGYSRCE
jgi:ribonucleoside-diphosphate reductase alpha chain